MDTADRSYSIGTCEKELEKIHRKLKGISDTIDEKIVESEMSQIRSLEKRNKESKQEESIDLHSLITCDENAFEENINKMTTVDLEMAVILFEQQIKIEMKINEDHNQLNGRSELNQLRERLTRCFLKKSMLSGSRTTAPFNAERTKLNAGGSMERKKVIDAASISSLSIEELKVLLTYNGLKIDNDKASRETLENMVRMYLVADEVEDDEEEGEDDDWEPPMDDSIDWKSPVFDQAPTKPSTQSEVEVEKQVETNSGPEAENIIEEQSHVPLENVQGKGEAEMKGESVGPRAQVSPTCTYTTQTSNGIKMSVELEQSTKSPQSSESDLSHKPDESPKSEQSSKSEESPESEQSARSGQSLEAEESPESKTEQSTKQQQSSESEQSAKSEQSLKAEESSESKTEQSFNSEQTAKSKQLANADESLKSEESPKSDQSIQSKQSSKSDNNDSKQFLSPVVLEDGNEKTQADSVIKSEESYVVNWNPIPLLKDLYRNMAKPEELQFKKADGTKQEAKKISKCKLDGYLEKLPVNQTKATVFKGWKKRYFKVTQGRLFYFEDHMSATPLGSILLTGSELKVPGDKTIQIKAQNNGDLISIRCLSSNECNDWYRTIKREAAISTPVTSPVPLSLQTDIPKSSTVVIDLGASAIKGGYTGENKPRVVFPAVFAVQTERKNGRKFTESGLPDPTLCKCGYEALEPETRQKSKLIFPLRPTLKIDKYAIKSRYLPGFIDKVFQELKADATESTVIISCQRNFGIREKEILLDYLFGQLGVKGAYIQEQAMFALYAYKDTTGIVVDIGDHIDVIPVLEGVIMENGVSCLPQGGQLVTEYLSRILSEGGYRFFSEVESYIVRYIKEQSSFVSLDYEKDISSSQNNIVIDMQKYDLPGNTRSVNIDDGRFRCAEGLFDPNKWGKDHEGIHKFVEKAIRQTGIDHRKEMCRKIYLSGGSTLIEGFPQRLQKELKFLMPETVNIQVHAMENRVNAAFLGATVISEQPSFSDLVISKEHWQQLGVNILH